jgi:hypothetical protein
MAPELILALVEDDDQTPPVTTASDVYSYACICLEVALQPVVTELLTDVIQGCVRSSALLSQEQ